MKYQTWYLDDAMISAAVPTGMAIVDMMTNTDEGCCKITLTPELAQFFLINQAPNRVFNKEYARLYGVDVSLGNWGLTGEALIFDQGLFNSRKIKQLLNGQTRAGAVISSGKSIETYIVWGIDREQQVKMDGGRKRNFGIQLGMLGYSNASVLASTTNALCVLDKLKTDWLETNQPQRISMRWEYWEDHKDEIMASTWATHHGRGKLHPRIACVAAILFSRRNEAACHEFFDKFQSGANLAKQDPILQLREYLVLKKYGQTIKRSGSEQLYACIIAWNDFRLNTSRRLTSVLGKALTYKKLPSIEFSSEYEQPESTELMDILDGAN